MTEAHDKDILLHCSKCVLQQSFFLIVQISHTAKIRNRVDLNRLLL